MGSYFVHGNNLKLSSNILYSDVHKFCILSDIILAKSFAATFILPPAKNEFLKLLNIFLVFANSVTNLSICGNVNPSSSLANFLNSANFFVSNPLNKNLFPLTISSPVTNNSSKRPINLFNSGVPLLILASFEILNNAASISLIASIALTCPEAILFLTLWIPSNISSLFNPLDLIGATKYLSIHWSRASLLAATSFVWFFIIFPTLPAAKIIGAEIIPDSTPNLTLLYNLLAASSLGSLFFSLSNPSLPKLPSNLVPLNHSDKVPNSSGSATTAIPSPPPIKKDANFCLPLNPFNFLTSFKASCTFLLLLATFPILAASKYLFAVLNPQSVNAWVGFANPSICPIAEVNFPAASENAIFSASVPIFPSTLSVKYFSTLATALWSGSTPAPLAKSINSAATLIGPFINLILKSAIPATIASVVEKLSTGSTSLSVAFL